MQFLKFNSSIVHTLGRLGLEFNVSFFPLRTQSIKRDSSSGMWETVRMIGVEQNRGGFFWEQDLWKKSRKKFCNCIIE